MRGGRFVQPRRRASLIRQPAAAQLHAGKYRQRHQRQIQNPKFAVQNEAAPFFGINLRSTIAETLKRT